MAERALAEGIEPEFARELLRLEDEAARSDGRARFGA